MTDMPALNPESEETPVPSGTEETFPEPPASTGKKRSKWTTIYRVVVLGIAIVVAGLWFMLNAEKPKVESVMEAHFSAMRDQDVKDAYSQLSTRNKDYYTSLTSFEGFMRTNSNWLKEYQGLTIDGMKLQRAVANHPSLPQGTIAVVSGEITFTNGHKEPYTATLEKEEGQWRIYGVQIGPPPDESSP